MLGEEGMEGVEKRVWGGGAACGAGLGWEGVKGALAARDRASRGNWEN